MRGQYGGPRAFTILIYKNEWFIDLKKNGTFVEIR